MMKAMWPVVMTNLGGFKVCGRRDGRKFYDLVRVRKEGYMRCNPDSKSENAIWVPEEGTRWLCPINGLKFLKNVKELYSFMGTETVSAEDIRGLLRGKLEFNGTKILVENGAPLRE